MVGDQVDVPDLLGAVAGYKILQLGKDRPLSSPYHQTCYWAEREQTANCLKHQYVKVFPLPQKHHAPDVDCKCGLYSFHAVDEFTKRYTPVYNGVSVVTLTSNVGRICVHQHGMRAERQRIEAMSVDSVHRSGYAYARNDPALFSRCVDAVMEIAEEWRIPFLEDWRELSDVAVALDLHPVPESLLP